MPRVILPLRGGKEYGGFLGDSPGFVGAQDGLIEGHPAER